MAYTSITKSSLQFSAITYTGNGSSGRDIAVPFDPGFSWIKKTNTTSNHFLFDQVRGDDKYINSNTTDTEYTESGGFAFGTNKFTLGSWGSVNNNSDSFISWNWKGATQQSLNSGNVTSTVRANTANGVSVVKWTGTAGNILVSHGLGAIPKVVMIKNLSNGSAQWVVYHVGTGNTKACYLNTSATPTTASGFFNNSTPDATDFIVSSDTAVNGNGNSMIAYCFANIKGFSKHGAYLGSGNSDGPFVYCGFKPRWVMVKATDNGGGWTMYDSAREPINDGSYPVLKADSNIANTTELSSSFDILSNGFKVRGDNSSSDNNATDSNYIYMAFAEEPLVANVGQSIPATAK